MSDKAPAEPTRIAVARKYFFDAQAELQSAVATLDELKAAVPASSS